MKRFPSIRSLQTCGLITSKELEWLRREKSSNFGLYWMPGCWFQDVTMKACNEGTGQSLLNRVDSHARF